MGLDGKGENITRRNLLQAAGALALSATVSLPETATAQTSLPVERLKEALTSGTIVLDVRAPDERTGPDGKEFDLKCPKCRTIRAPFNHLTDGAFGFDDKNDALLEKLKQGRPKVVVICREGIRSAAAAKELAKRGFGRVYNLEGGMKILPDEMRSNRR